VKTCDPIPHNNFSILLSNARAVITDSSGVQEESVFFMKPTVVCREHTERNSALDSFEFICKSPNDLIEVFEKALKSPPIENYVCPYGDGYASKRSLEVIKGYLYAN
jgi:UDP-N-acetylglucosamine 2-epimerase (non-hydrolysing)